MKRAAQDRTDKSNKPERPAREVVEVLNLARHLFVRNCMAQQADVDLRSRLTRGDITPDKLKVCVEIVREWGFQDAALILADEEVRRQKIMESMMDPRGRLA